MLEEQRQKGRRETLDKSKNQRSSRLLRVGTNPWPSLFAGPSGRSHPLPLRVLHQEV